MLISYLNEHEDAKNTVKYVEQVRRKAVIIRHSPTPHIAGINGIAGAAAVAGAVAPNAA